MSRELVFDFGKRIRDALFENIENFVDDLTLVDEKEFYPLHADFCSRLGMTFSHGDYAHVEAIRDRDQIAEGLFRKALNYHPDARAYLGLGLLHQKRRDFDGAMDVLRRGLELFPESKELNLCMGISYMNVARFEKALAYLLKIQDSPEAKYYIEQCHQELSP